MTSNEEPKRRVAMWLGAASLGLAAVWLILGCPGLRAAAVTVHADHPQGTHRGVWSVAFSPDGKTLASGSIDRTIKLWDVATGKERATLQGHTDWVFVRGIQPGRQDAGLGERGQARSSCGTWRRARNRPPSRDTRTRCGPWRSARTARRWPRGAATGRSSCGTWRPARSRPLSRGHTSRCRSVAFSPDGKTLASGSNDKTIKLWDVATGKEQATLKGHTERGDFRGVQPGRQDAGLGERGQDDQAVGRGDGQGTGHPQGTHETRCVSVAFSPDGKTLASGSEDQTIKLWDVATGKEKATLQGHTANVFSVAFSPDGKTLAACSWEDTVVKLWDVTMGE